jgi:hypothetical protein
LEEYKKPIRISKISASMGIEQSGSNDHLELKQFILKIWLLKKLQEPDISGTWIVSSKNHLESI